MFSKRHHFGEHGREYQVELLERVGCEDYYLHAKNSLLVSSCPSDIEFLYELMGYYGGGCRGNVYYMFVRLKRYYKIKRLVDFGCLSDSDILKFDGCGEKTLFEIRKHIKNYLELYKSKRKDNVPSVYNAGAGLV